MGNLKHKGNIEVTDGNITIDGQPIGGGGGIEGTQYIFVSANGTPIENAQELQDAYDEAKTLLPTSDNRITIIAAPGNYNFNSNFVMDAEYIDLVSLDGNRSIIFNGSDTIDIKEDNIKVIGVDTETKPFLITEDNLDNLVLIRCKGGNNSFGSNSTGTTGNIISGTFIECECGNNSVGNGNTGDIQGAEFYRCKFGNSCLSPWNTSGVNVKLIDCETSGGILSVPTGPNTYVEGGVYRQIGAIGPGIIDGLWVNVKAGNGSFGGFGTSIGKFYNCICSDEFGMSTSVGGWGENANGEYYNCHSYFNDNTDTFGYSSASGVFYNCTTNYAGFGKTGTTSGTFTNCVGGAGSFASNGTLSGKLYNCRLTSGTFQTVSGGGVTVLCIDGNNQINTQN